MQNNIIPPVRSFPLNTLIPRLTGENKHMFVEDNRFHRTENVANNEYQTAPFKINTTIDLLGIVKLPLVFFNTPKENISINNLYLKICEEKQIKEFVKIKLLGLDESKFEKDTSQRTYMRALDFSFSFSSFKGMENIEVTYPEPALITLSDEKPDFNISYFHHAISEVLTVKGNANLQTASIGVSSEPQKFEVEGKSVTIEVFGYDLCIN